MTGDLMRIQVHGKQIDVGDSLREHVIGTLSDATGKYGGRAVEAAVTFSRDAHEFVCVTSVHLSTGLSVQATSRGTEIYEAFERCTERMAKQLRRYKRRLKNHHQRRDGAAVEATEAVHSVLAAEPEAEDVPERLEPVVIAESITQVRALTVGEAVMQLELADAPVLVFRSEAHGGLNVVYRRADGNIGWIDPRAPSSE
jgi:ribosome hibernation promoting factor